jgi:Domain of unknown function (DUF4062)
MKVFISSVVTGFEAERDAAAAAATTLGCEVRRCEDFGALEKSPQEACLDGVRWADVVVLLLGERYGGVLPSGISATHEEYHEARNRGTALAFAQTNADFEPDQRKFVDEVRDWQGGLNSESFADPDELQRKVTRAVHDFALRKAAAPFDVAMLRSQALSRTPERSLAPPPIAHVAVAVAPEVTILSPTELQDVSLQRVMRGVALLGANAILDPSVGSSFQLSGDLLDLEQSLSNHLAIDQRGCIWMSADVTHRGGGIVPLGVVLEEELAEMIARMFRLASELLDATDHSRRLTHVLPVTMLDRGHAALRTRDEQAASPSSFSIPMSPERHVADWPRDVLTRPALSRDAESLARNVVAQFRQMAQSR